MDNSIVVTITEDGDLLYLAHENTEFLSELGTVREQRASHVEPASFILRAIFHAIRRVTSDESRIAEFTRHWPCFWRVDASPIGGNILTLADVYGESFSRVKYAMWTDRQAAIAAEIEYVNQKFIQ